VNCGGSSPDQLCIEQDDVCNKKNDCGNNWDELPETCGQFAVGFIVCSTYSLHGIGQTTLCLRKNAPTFYNRVCMFQFSCKFAFLATLRLSNVIKIDPYIFELYCFKVGAFFLRHMSVRAYVGNVGVWTVAGCTGVTDKAIGTIVKKHQTRRVEDPHGFPRTFRCPRNESAPNTPMLCPQNDVYVAECVCL